MKKETRNWLFTFAMILLGSIVMVSLNSCDKDDDPVEDPIATFQYEIGENWLEVIFTNFSSHATSYSWAFGDGNTSTEENPTHTYAEVGNYDVTLTATNSAGVSANFTQTIEVKDPDEALALLAGQTSKTWRLYRVESSMGVGPNMEIPRDWWALFNDGSRPCVYFHEFTFNRNMEYIFDDKGTFWTEGITDPPTCAEAIPANMVNDDGFDFSAWLSGTHQFEYNSSTNKVTIIGEGAWIGLPKTGTTGEVTVPQTSVTFNIQIEERTGYDYMHLWFVYDFGIWSFSYAHYHDPSLEPPVEEELAPWGENLPNLTPTELYHTFESETSFAHIGAIGGSSIITVGEDDPDGGETKVGMFERIAGQQYQEAQLRTYPDLYDIQFDNFSVAKIDIFIPADTDFADGGLQRHFVFGFADVSATQEWWNSPVQFAKSGDDVVLGEWHTYTFDLTDVKEREDLDMIYLGIGGGAHEAGGIFYIRNLVFE